MRLERDTASANAAADRIQSSLARAVGWDDSTAMPPEDDTAIALSEDTAARYEAYGWHVQIVEGGEVAAVKKAATFPPAGPTS